MSESEIQAFLELSRRYAKAYHASHDLQSQPDTDVQERIAFNDIELTLRAMSRKRAINVIEWFANIGKV